MRRAADRRERSTPSARRSRPRPPTADEHERAAAGLLEGWADLFAPMIAPDRYRLLLQLGALGVISDAQARGLSALWRAG
jgi:hypothetical protein